LKQLIAPKLK